MRICFFADGRNVHVQRLGPALAARGHLVHLVTCKPVELEGVSVERYRVPDPGLRYPYRWGRRREEHLKRILRGFDVTVVFFLRDWGFTPEILREGCVVASPRGSDIVPPPGEGRPSAELVRQRVSLLRHADCVGVSCSYFAEAVAAFAGLDRSEIQRLPLGVDLNRFRAVAKARSSNGLRIVGFLKGFRPVYGASTLIRAIPEVMAGFPNALFELVGDGADLDSCRKLVTALGVERHVRWLPRQPHVKVPQVLTNWNLSVLPSLCEGFGVAALESSAAGVPVVASRIGGLPETVRDGDTGVLVPPQRPDELAKAIFRLLKDDESRTRMGAAGRKFVEAHYSWPRVLDVWEKTLSLAVERHQDRRTNARTPTA